MVYGSETWGTTTEIVNRLRRNDRAMTRWICQIRPEQEVSSEHILSILELEDIGDILSKGRLRWYGHVERNDGWISEVRNIRVERTNAKAGRPKTSWNSAVERDRAQLGMDQTDPQERQAWRRRLRPRLDNQAAPS